MPVIISTIAIGGGILTRVRCGKVQLGIHAIEKFYYSILIAIFARHIPLCDHQVNSRLKAVSSAKLFPQRSEPLELPFRSASAVYKRKLYAI
jgi:hypothetical protein